jgi:hypothetical protein
MRAVSGRFDLGESFADTIDPEYRAEIVEYFSAQYEKALAVSTQKGTAILFPIFYSSSAMLLVSFVRSEKRGSLIDKAMAHGLFSEIHLIGECIERRMRRKDDKTLYDLTAVLESVKELKSNIDNIGIICESVSDEKFNNLFRSAAKIIGVPIKRITIEDVCVDDRFDATLFASFLVSALMLCRRAALDRSIEISVERCYEGIKLCVEFVNTSKLPLVFADEMLPFSGIAERCNMMFEYSSDEEKTRIAFVPSRKDWSCLGLKTVSEFEWDS